jgi:hypothetical protein
MGTTNQQPFPKEKQRFAAAHRLWQLQDLLPKRVKTEG